MRYIALFQHGSQWKPGLSVYEQGAPIRAHLTKMCERYDDGSLLLGGPFEDGRAGGIAVLEVADESAAVAFLEADPAVIAGVLTYDLHLLHAYFDAFTGVRTAAPVSDLAALRNS